MKEPRRMIHTTLKASSYKKIELQARAEKRSIGDLLDNLIETQGYYLSEALRSIQKAQERNIIEIIHRIVI